MSEHVPPAEGQELPAPPPPVPDGASSLAPAPGPRGPIALRSMKGLANAVTVMIVVVVLVNLAAIPNDLAYISSLQDLVDGDFSTISAIEDQEDLRGTFGVLLIAAMIATGIIWIIWQQRARSNARALGAGGQRQSETMAVVGWFIPIVNLVLPKQVTDDLWRASDPDAPAAMAVGGRPVWEGVHSWWGLWVVGALIGRLLLRGQPVESLDDIDGLVTMVRFEILSQLILLAAGVLAIMVVRRITDRLSQRAKNAGVLLP